MAKADQSGGAGQNRTTTGIAAAALKGAQNVGAPPKQSSSTPETSTQKSPAAQRATAGRTAKASRLDVNRTDASQGGGDMIYRAGPVRKGDSRSDNDLTSDSSGVGRDQGVPGSRRKDQSQPRSGNAQSPNRGSQINR